MDFGLSAAEAATIYGIEPDDDHTAIDTSALTFADAIARVRRTIERDPVMINTLIAAIGADTLRAALSPKQSILPFPVDVGTIECSIWDNLPFTKAKKAVGDTSRERPARFAVTLKASVRGKDKPITSRPDFKATGDLFTSTEIRTRLKKAWKDMSQIDLDHLTNDVLPIADANDLLIARLFITAKGAGKHWHQGHFLLIPAEGLMSRDLSGAILIVSDRLVQLAPFSTTDATGDAFPINERVTESGKRKTSTCILQSRSSDLASLRRTWITGDAA